MCCSWGDKPEALAFGKPFIEITWSGGYVDGNETEAAGA